MCVDASVLSPQFCGAGEAGPGQRTSTCHAELRPDTPGPAPVHVALHRLTWSSAGSPGPAPAQLVEHRLTWSSTGSPGPAPAHLVEYWRNTRRSGREVPRKPLSAPVLVNCAATRGCAAGRGCASASSRGSSLPPPDVRTHHDAGPCPDTFTPAAPAVAPEPAGRRRGRGDRRDPGRLRRADRDPGPRWRGR